MNDLDDRIEREVLRQLYRYWLAKCDGRIMPTPQDVDPVEMRFIIGNLLLVDVSEGAERFAVRLHGTKLAERFGFDMTGKRAEDFPYQEYRRFSERQFAAAVAARAPHYVREDIVADDRIRRVEALILPLSRDGVRVERLLVGTFHDE